MIAFPKGYRFCVVLWIVFMLLTVPVAAAEKGTVITLEGEVWVSGEKSTWNKVSSGMEIPFGVTLRTGKNSLVGILNPDGSMLRVKQNSKIVYQPGTAEETSTGFFTILSELFSKRIRARIGGSRGEEEGSCPEQKFWLELMSLDPVPDDKTELYFLTASDYAQCGDLARAAAIFYRLYEAYPGNAGYRNLSYRALENAKKDYSINMKSRWSVFVKQQTGKQVFARDRNQVEAGSEFRVHYHAERDSYFYLLTVLPQTGEADLLFPPELYHKTQSDESYHFASFVKKGRRGIVFPKQWQVLSPVSQEMVLWGWSCFAPVSRTSLRTVNTKLTSMAGGEISVQEFSDIIPEFCTRQLVQYYTVF